MTWLLARLVAALVCVGVAGCSSGLVGAVEVDDVVVGVRASGCSLVEQLGTGAVIDVGGRVVVITSAHTVAGSETVVVVRGTAELVGRVIEFDADLDVAVLDVDGLDVDGLDVDGLAVDGLGAGRPLADPVAGESVVVGLWDPDDGVSPLFTSIDRLLRVTIEDIYVEDDVERRGFDFAGDIVAGDSGAPVLNDEGAVVGMVFARSRERAHGFAISSTELGPLIQQTNDDPADVGRCI